MDNVSCSNVAYTDTNHCDRTSLIIYQHLRHQKQETSAMSWTAISLLMSRMLQMFSHGGMNAVDHSLISPEWRWII
jgi:hypothetical protein